MLFDVKPPSMVVPVSLADYTKPALIISELQQTDTAGIVSELSQVLQQEGFVPDLLPFYHTALNQELLSSSALESGLAVPHGRLCGVRHLQFALGRLRQPANWGPGKSWPVDLVFLLAVPATDAASYLHLLAGIARLGQQPGVLADLRAAQTPNSIWEVLAHFPIRREVLSTSSSSSS
jgi:mannitol/fructose-specific phosphotransferase system IIA component (Ntr-type)